MPGIIKPQTIFLVIILILIIAGVLYFVIPTQEETKEEEETEAGKEEVSSKEEAGQEIKVGQEATAPKEIFLLRAVVLRVNPDYNYLIVTPVDEEKEIKVILSEGTKLIKLETPPEQKEGVFTPIQTTIQISDFKKGDSILIKAKEDIKQKTEIDNIEFVQVFS